MLHSCFIAMRKSDDSQNNLLRFYTLSFKNTKKGSYGFVKQSKIIHSKAALYTRHSHSQSVRESDHKNRPDSGYKKTSHPPRFELAVFRFTSRLCLPLGHIPRTDNHVPNVGYKQRERTTRDLERSSSLR